MAVSIGQMLGPAAAGIIVTAVDDLGNWDGNTAVFLAGAASAVAATALAVWLPRRPVATSSAADGADTARPRVITVMRQPGMTRAMLVSVTVVTATGMYSRPTCLPSARRWGYRSAP